MTSQPDAKLQTTGSSAVADVREARSDDERNALLALRIATRNPAREERRTKDEAAFLHLIENL